MEKMTHRQAEFRYYAAFVCCLVWTNLYASYTEAQNVSTNEVVQASRPKGSQAESEGQLARLVLCPSEPAHTLARLLGVVCERSSDCSFLGSEQRCCKGLCRRAVNATVYEPPHAEFLGIRRKCPTYSFPERLPVKRCSKDDDCEGVNRICCPDKSDKRLYCRTAAPIWSELPFPENQDALKTLAGFVQCQPPPPPVLDIFSRSCNRTVDCLPNLCCQEGSKKVCRPPKQSILSVAVQATSRFVQG